MEKPVSEENPNVSPEPPRDIHTAYGTDRAEAEKEQEYAKGQIQRINDALQLREQNSLVTNGISYSRSYLYNQQKAINYAPPRNPKDDREVSMGLVHEKIISFVALFIKYRFKRRIKCYDKDGKLIPGMGEFYDLAIEFSHRMEQFVKLIALIYWELFTQGNAFVGEEWDVRTLAVPDAYNGKDKVTADTMDYTYEFLEGLTYKPGKEFQTRRAISRLYDGRMVIFGNPEIVEVQDQPFIVLEEELDRADAEQLYGTLTRWEYVPRERTQIETITPEKTTLFGVERLAKPETRIIVHRIYDKVNNRFNIFLNGLMMLPRETPMTLFYPRNNYPLTNIPCERLTGSIYARSIPAKTKHNADYIDWVLKIIAQKFEQGAIPAILAKGKYTLSRDIFRAGQVTHGVSKGDYEKADPENKGITPSEFSFVQLIKDIFEAQTLNPTTTGEIQPNATATEISITEQNQLIKLGYLLDGLCNGFMDMALRRAETIESKYTIKQKETVVNGKTLSVYQNFNINVGGVNHSVIFDDAIGSPEYGHDAKRNELFTQAFQARKDGFPTEYYLADPLAIRKGEYDLDIEIFPERMKEVGLQLQELWNEFTNLLNTFGPNLNIQELQKIYLDISGRPHSIFNSADMMKLQEMEQATGQPIPAPMMTNNKGGKPQRKPALLQ